MNKLISDEVETWIEEVHQAEKIKILWCITAYNESGEALLSSLGGIKQNLDYLSSKGQKSLAQQVTLCLIFDGLEKIPISTLNLLEKLDLCCLSEIAPLKEINLFQSYLKLEKLERLIELKILNKQDNSSWINVYNTAQEVNQKCTDLEVVDSVRVLICIKKQNRGKLHSHWWFFQVFCHYIQPIYCIQMDIGSVPTTSNLYNLWEFMETHFNVGGAEGMILTSESPYPLDIISLWQAAGFHRESLFSKPTEIITGYLGILPGQFSFLRWQALTISDPKKYEESRHLTPLDNYFQGLEGGSIFKSNIFLTEDRVLGFGIVTSLDNSWRLAHLPSVITITEPCQSLSELMNQRRRWFNGAFACNLWILIQIPKYLMNQYGKWLAKLHLIRSLPLSFLKLFYNWFGLAGLVILYYEINKYIQDLLLDNNRFFWDSRLTTSVGIFLIVFYLITCLTNTINQFIWLTNIVYFILLTLMLIIFTLYLNQYFFCLIIGFIAILTWLLAQVYSPWLANQTRKQFLIYLFLEIPISTLINIYAFCNIDNCSWGTKGLSQGQRNDWYRVFFVSIWLLSNSLLLVLAFKFNLYQKIMIVGFLEYAIALISGVFMGGSHLFKKFLKT